MSDVSNSNRPLEGMVIGISVSGSDDLSAWGYSAADVNRAIVRLSEGLLAAGARLMFGQDWQPDGVMDAICRLALRYQPAEKSGPSVPLIHNLLAWPNKPSMDPSLRSELEQRGVLKIETLPAPRDEWISPTLDTAKALASTEMRRRLAKDCDARICLSGALPTDQTRGFYAGVIEEAYLTAKKGKPVYFANFLGGACSSLVTYLKGQDSDKQHVQTIFSVITSKQQILEDVNPRLCAATTSDGPRSDDQLPEDFGRLPVDLREGFDDHDLQQRSGLSAVDWDQLLDSADTETFVTLVIRGLREVARRRSTPKSQSEADPGPDPKPVRTRTRKPRPPK